MKIALMLLLSAMSLMAHAETHADNITDRCLSVAKQHADEHGGPWSDDAEYAGATEQTCSVRVTQTCHIPPYERYNMKYMIEMSSWTVSYFEADGCFYWP